MLTLYSSPTLFGVADNNGYGLKVFAFLKLAGVPCRHEHIFDASKAPRSQLPYIIDGDDIVGDSETILAYVTQKYRLTIDAALTPAHDEPSDHPHAPRPLLGDVVFALERRTLLACVPQRTAARTSNPDGRKLGQDASVQFPALLLPGHWPLRSRCRDGARARGSRGARRSNPPRGYLHSERPTSVDAGIYG